LVIKLITLFQKEIEKIGGKATKVSTMEELLKVIDNISLRNNSKIIAMTDLKTYEKDIEKNLTSNGLKVIKTKSSKIEIIKEADIGITLAEIGISDSGTIGISFERNIDLAVSALPYIHIVILNSEKLVNNLFDAYEYIDNNIKKNDKRTISLISGPSKTADVEQILIKGVHGPNELHVIIVESEFK
tara:strand:- start:182 stop:742 length:561 start_codon:yes stop_codon:yes gene_type:complete